MGWLVILARRGLSCDCSVSLDTLLGLGEWAEGGVSLGVEGAAEPQRRTSSRYRALGAGG